MCDEKQNDGNSGLPKELFTVYLTNGLLYDKLHTLATEYSLPVELLANLAVKRLVEDVTFVRNLRLGRIEGV